MSSNKGTKEVVPFCSKEAQRALEGVLEFAKRLIDEEQQEEEQDQETYTGADDSKNGGLPSNVKSVATSSKNRQTSYGSASLIALSVGSSSGRGGGGQFYNSSDDEDENQSSSEDEQDDDEDIVGGPIQHEVNAHKVYDPKYHETSTNSKHHKHKNVITATGALSSTAATTTVPSLILPFFLKNEVKEAEKETMDDSKRISTLLQEGSKLEYLQTLMVPTVILTPGRTDWNTYDVTQEYLNWSRKLSNKKMAVILLRSGRFAAGIFDCTTGKCLVHTTSTRYTVRKGQGGAQSSNDNAKGKAKSIGSQLRREGERALKEDVRNALTKWSDYFRDVKLLFISCPKVMKRSFFDECTKGIFTKEDPRIRSIPLAIKRPSFDEVCRVYETLFYVTIRPMSNDERNALRDAISSTFITNKDTNTKTNGNNLPVEVIAIAQDTKSENANQLVTSNEEHANKKEVPLSPLHIAARDANVEALNTFLDQMMMEDSSSPVDEDEGHQSDALVATSSVAEEGVLGLPDFVNARCGSLDMTPLHYAANYEGDNVGDACAFVRTLLERGHANPCIIDKHGRPPYFVCHNDKLRDTFRLARGTLGEGYCDWDNKAKVGPPLTKDLLDLKKEKAAEKKRRQRARQKEKKAQERKQAEEEAQREKERLEEEQRLEEAKRIRDGLQPKKTTKSGHACDFCQTIVKKKSQMFTRLSYQYCSSECVKRHQRELMAAAATARLGGGNS